MQRCSNDIAWLVHALLAQGVTLRLQGCAHIRRLGSIYANGYKVLQDFAGFCRARQNLLYLAGGIVTSCRQVCYFDCQLWGVQAEAGSLAGEDLSKCPSSNALLVLVHAAVKQKPDRTRMGS